MAEISDLVNFAVNKNPVEFADTFDQLVRERAALAVDARKVEIATALYGQPEEINDDDIEDFNLDDDTLDDLDLGEDETSGLEDTDNEDV